MALFHFGKQKDEGKSSTGSCSCQNRQEDSTESKCACGCKTGNGAAVVSGELKSVKVLGSGCKNCHALLVNTNQALRAMGVPFEAEYVTDMAKIAAYGIMSTPALVANEKVVSMGKVLSAAEVEKLLLRLVG